MSQFFARRWLRGVLVGLLLLIAGLGLWSQTSWFWRFIYPFYYRDIINRAAQDNGLSPYLVAAVVRTESAFSPLAQSHQGARGLMQVVPDTGQWAAREMGLVGYTDDLLYDPEVNVRIGTWYLARLLRDFDGNLPAALAAYNGGILNVRLWLRQGVWDGRAETVERVPFRETRQFVRRVLSDYQRYQRIYGGP